MPRLGTVLSTTLAAALLVALPAEAKDNRHCPPGLAKKAVPCVPPGQAKKLHGGQGDHWHGDHWHGDWRQGDWRQGDRVRGDYVLIPRSDWERLALRDYRDGSAYLSVDNQILRVMRDTLVVLEAVRIIDRVLD